MKQPLPPHPSRDPARRGLSRRAVLALLGLLALLALVIRLKTWGEGLDDGAPILHFGGTDPYYHLRRLNYLLANGFSLPHWDFYCHFPTGVASPWPPLFDLLMGAFVRSSCWGALTQFGIEWRAALWPALLGAATVGPVYLLARRLLGRGPALVAVLLFALCPAHAFKSFAGRPDHHVLEVLLAVLIFWVLLGTLRPIPSSWGRWSLPVGLGVLLTAALLTWLGSMTFVAMTATVLLAAILHEAWERGSPGKPAIVLAISHLGAAALILPFSLTTLHGRQGLINSELLSLFQPAILGALGLAGVVLAGMLATPVGRSRPFAMATATTLGLGLVGLTTLLITPMGAALAQGAAFVRQAMPGELLPWESHPLLGAIDLPGLHASGLAQAWRHFGLMLAAAPIGAILVARRCLEDRSRASRQAAILLLAFSTGAMALLQARFAHLAAPFAALLSAYAIGPRPGATTARGGRVGFGIALLVLPSLVTLRPASWLPATADQAWLQPISLDPPPRDLENAALWLGRHSEDPGGYLDEWRRPTYGVMVYWDWGHLFMARARRPVLATPFLHLYPFEATSRFFLADSETEGLAILKSRRVRYIISTKILPDTVNLRQFAHVIGKDPDDYITLTDGRPVIQPAFGETLFFRLQYLDAGPALEIHRRTFGSAIPDEVFPDESLAQLRLVAEFGTSKAHWDRVKIFERVEGARLRIRYRGTGPLWVRAVVRAGDGRLFPFGRRTRPAGGGVHKAIVPYPPAGNQGEIGVVDGYVVIDKRGRTLRRIHLTGSPLAGSTVELDLGQ